MGGVSALDGIVREDLAGERVLVAHVHRAEPFTKGDPPQVASIIIREPLPPEHHEHTVEEAYVRFRDDAERIHAALSHACPGGTLDALFALMAAERASAYVVPGQWHDGARNLRALVEQTRELVEVFGGEATRPETRDEAARTFTDRCWRCGVARAEHGAAEPADHEWAGGPQ